MKGLVVGLGSIGRRHASNWAALELGPLAVCHRDDDVDQALQSEQPDVVLVTNPTSLHLDAACRAVRAGAHVFVEKPLGHTLVGVPEVLDEAAQRRANVMVGYNLRFHPGLRRLKELVDAGAVGRIVSARAEVGEYLPSWHPWEDYRASYSARRDLGGGAVLTFSHDLDALYWVLGAPRRVTAMAAHVSSLEIDVEDVAEIVIEFESGVLGSVHVDYVRRPTRRQLEVVGEAGVLRWEYEPNRLWHYRAEVNQWRVEEGDPRYERNHMYLDELRAVAATVQSQTPQPPLATGQEGAAVLALALAALRSAAEGRTIEL